MILPMKKLFRQSPTRLVSAGTVAALLLVTLLAYSQRLRQPVTQKKENCTVYFELRGVNFLVDSMRSRLCESLTAYTIVGGRFPLCQLPARLPEEIEQEVRRRALRNFITNSVTGRNVSIYTYQPTDYISREIALTHSWEPLLVSRLINIMKALPSPKVTFLDIGSNIGVYSLQAIDAGFSTIAVDANIRNLARMRLSVSQSRQQHLMRMFWAFFHTQVSIRYLEFDATFCNVGGGSGSTYKTEFISDTVPVTTAVGDDLLPHVQTQLVVMKIDIEASESMFFETATQLMDTRHVAAVQMEWWRTDLEKDANTLPNHRYLVDYFTSRNYALFCPITLKRLDPESFKQFNTIWVRRDFISAVMKTVRADVLM